MVEPVLIRSSQRDQLREERLEILRLLEAGAITADEAATLLDALDRASFPPRTADRRVCAAPRRAWCASGSPTVRPDARWSTSPSRSG